MTEEARQQIKMFEAKVRQLLLQYKEQENRIALLESELTAKNEELNNLNSQLSKTQQDYNNLKMARMMSLSDSDINDTKQRITRLVRKINKCIALLGTED